MADNAARIAAIRAVLESGAQSVNIDGVSVAINHDTLRQELARLMAEDDSAGDRRPAAATILLN